jgi:hypothetical protein
MKNILIYFLVIISSISCSNKTKEMVIYMDVYYVLEDTFLGNNNKCRVLINIPKDNILEYNTGEGVILSLRNEAGVLKFSHIFNGQKKENEFYLEATVLGLFKNGFISLEPHFSPIKVNKELLDSLNYEKGRTVMLSVKVGANKKKYIEYIDSQLKDIKLDESIRVK